MFDKIRSVINSLTTATPAPNTAITTSGSAAATAPATVPGTRADLIEIKVNGLDAAKANAVWLTRGLDRGSATCVKLVDLTSDHLKNIVTNKPNLSPDYLRVIESILEDRGETLPTTPDASDAIVTTTDDDNDPFKHLS